MNAIISSLSALQCLYTVIIGYVIFKRLLTYLHILQQDNYYSKRFLDWFIQNKAYDRYMTSVIVLCITINWLMGAPSNHPAYYILALTALLYFAFKEPNPLSNAKLKLVLTFRAKRILSASIILFIPIFYYNDYTLTSLILIIQSTPFILILGNLITLPLEHHIQKNYLIAAKQTLETLNPTVIGITGSYGKTSMKYILGHILNKYQPTLFTPASINTPMGICSVIQNKLKPNHKFFIVEMGAYQMGSIKKLCALTPPNIGTVTSIGPCHLERFGSMENVAKGKSELLAAIEQNSSHLGFSFPKELNQLDAFKKYAASNLMIPPLVCVKKEQTTSGIVIHIKEGTATTELKAPIFGIHQADNITLAVTIARKLGAPMELIKSALLSVKQVSARLEVKHDTNDITWINDGFNANPAGFTQALELLKQFGTEKNGRKILVTPGLIELGEQHDEIHAQLAKQAMHCTDILIIVAPQRIDAFVKTADLLKKPTQIILHVNSFTAAKQWLDKNLQTKDTILLANDLPDILETRPNI